MKKLLFLGIAIICCSFSQIEDTPIGIWSIKDNPEDPNLILIELYEESENVFSGKIITIDIPNSEELKCIKCEGDLKDKPLIGLEVIQSMKKFGSEWGSGKILNPSTGVNASGEAWFENYNNPNVLIVRSAHELNVSTQKWYRIK